MYTMTIAAAAIDEPEPAQHGHGLQSDTTRIERLPVGTRFRLTLDEDPHHVAFVFGTIRSKSFTCTTVVLESRDPQNPRPWDGKPIGWANSTLVTRIPKLIREVVS